MIKFLKRLFSDPIGYLPEAMKRARRDMSASSAYYRDGRDRSTGLSWLENQVIEDGLNRVVELVSREYIANENAGTGVRERPDVEEVAADRAGGQVAVAETEGAFLG